MDVILVAIPFFFLLIGIELLVEWRKGSDFYRLNDAIASLNVGVLSRAFGIFYKLVPLTLYILVFDAVSLFEWPDTWITWALAFVLYDFFYYWNHRLGHEINVLWAAHVVHHSSEEYNLTTALRQTSGGVLSWIFYLPLAVMGFEPALIVTIAALNLVYQFWVHTRHVPKLGWYEWFFVTPSNHRVHHAQNQIYLDRNYGGVFILWDRLFGTFQEELEDEKPVYGVKLPLKSWNPMWANLQVYGQLVKDCIATESWSDKFKIWFARTGWRPVDVSESNPITLPKLENFKKFDIQLSQWRKNYAVVQFILLSVLVVTLMMQLSALSTSAQLMGGLVICLFSTSLGGMLETRTWAYFSESAKWIALAFVAISYANLAVSVAVVCASIVSLTWLWWLAKEPGNYDDTGRVISSL